MSEVKPNRPPRHLTAEMMARIKNHPMTSIDDQDEWHKRLGWLICVLDVLNSPSVQELDGLSLRTRNCLKYGGINDVARLQSMTEDELVKLPNLGRASLNEIKAALAKLPAQ